MQPPHQIRPARAASGGPAGLRAPQRSISAAVVAGPRLMRRVPRTRVSGRPMAWSTWLGSMAPEEQAEPVETATLARSSATSSPSAGTPRNPRLSVLGRRGASAPLRKNPGSPASWAAKRSRRSAMRRAFSARWTTAHSAAATNPATRNRLSVPARRPRSCRPPRTRPGSRRPSRSTSAPTPLGPPTLWAARVAASTPHSPRGTGMRPRACAASVCSSASAGPCSRARAASSATGWTTPVSLLAAISETSRV